MNVTPDLLLRKIGQLTIENDLLRARAQDQERQIGQLTEQLLAKPESNGHTNRLTETASKAQGHD